MSNKSVLIAYGSRYGSTEEISHEIAEVLESEGLTTRIVDLKKTKKKDWPSIRSFDGIIVGSSIKMMRWMREPRDFLKKHAAELKKREKVVGIFVSAGSASRPGDRPKAKGDYIEKVLAALSVEVDISDAFGGVFDFSPSSRAGFFDKRMLKMAAKEMAKDTDLTIEEGGKIDLRDWEQIRTFAKQFAELVKR